MPSINKLAYLKTAKMDTFVATPANNDQYPLDLTNLLPVYYSLRIDLKKRD